MGSPEAVSSSTSYASWGLCSVNGFLPDISWRIAHLLHPIKNAGLTGWWSQTWSMFVFLRNPGECDTTPCLILVVCGSEPRYLNQECSEEHPWVTGQIFLPIRPSYPSESAREQASTTG